MAIEFSTEIRLGDLLTVVAFIGVGVSAFYNIKGRLDVQDVKMENMDEKIDNITNERMERDVETLKRDVSKLSGQYNVIMFRLGINKPDGEYTSHGKEDHGVG